jgi:hypothetical protein
MLHCLLTQVIRVAFKMHNLGQGKRNGAPRWFARAAGAHLQLLNKKDLSLSGIIRAVAHDPTTQRL